MLLSPVASPEKNRFAVVLGKMLRLLVTHIMRKAVGAPLLDLGVHEFRNGLWDRYGLM